MKWNILVISGKETNKYFVSTGEGIQKNRKEIFLSQLFFLNSMKILCYVRPKKVRVLYQKV